MNNNTSASLFAQAQKSIPGGVNSPVRAFRGVGGHPIFFKSAKGAHLIDVDGNQYIDYINSWGPMILGHGHPEVIEAIHKQANEALSFGAPTELEIKMAELVKSMAPNVDLIRMVNSGTEACMSAIRLARGYTGRNKIIKFEGCYHGHADSFLIKAGSGVATLNIQTVPGVTAGVANDTITLPYNDLDTLQNLLAEKGSEVAAIIIEPVVGNMGCVPPQQGFLQVLRLLCDKYNIVLIFDEVMTGFRLAQGGAQQLFEVDADLVTYGKVIGGGLPVGAFGGKQRIMEHIAPLGNVYQAGTLSGNPIAMAAGFATLTILKNNPQIYTDLNAKTTRLKNEIASFFSSKGKAVSINQVGSMMSVHFTDKHIENYEDAVACDIPFLNKFFHHMLSHGVYLPPSGFESWFISNALSDSDINFTIEALKKFNF